MSDRRFRVKAQCSALIYESGNREKSELKLAAIGEYTLYNIGRNTYKS